MTGYKSTYLFLFSDATIFEKLLFGGRQFILETASSRFTVLQLGTHFRAILLKSVKMRMGGESGRELRVEYMDKGANLYQGGKRGGWIGV